MNNYRCSVEHERFSLARARCLSCDSVRRRSDCRKHRKRSFASCIHYIYFFLRSESTKSVFVRLFFCVFFSFSYSETTTREDISIVSISLDRESMPEAGRCCRREARHPAQRKKQSIASKHVRERERISGDERENRRARLTSSGISTI